jgi:ribosomal protein L11 methyltransferase
MQDVVAQGDVVADLGAGSAVLSIAAAKLGAARVIAIEVDPDAIGNAEDNVARNGVADRVTVLEGDAATLLPLVAPIRVVFANIISSVIVQLLPTIRDALSDRGAGILAGVLVEEHDDIEREIARSGFRVERSLSDGLWWSATIIRR